MTDHWNKIMHIFGYRGYLSASVGPDLKADHEFCASYEAARDAETVPAKKKAMLKFFKEFERASQAWLDTFKWKGDKP